MIYVTGIGRPKDPAKAAEWAAKSAEQGNAGAQALLATMYQSGQGVAKDLAKAMEWRQKAAAQGNSYAQRSLAAMYPQGDSGPTTVLRIAPSTTNKLTKQRNGTLFVVSKTGLAITNQHVTTGCSELRVQGREGVAKLITEDTVNDLALVQIPAPVTDAAAITSEPGKLRQGEDIVAFGFPLNSLLSSGGNLTPGVISALTGLGNNTNQIQITAPMQPGSSGSPVLNKKGEVVGVVSMKLSDSKMMQSTGQVGQSVNFAASGQTLKAFLDVNMVKYRTLSKASSRDKSTADLADEARKWTLLVECWR